MSCSEDSRMATIEVLNASNCVSLFSMLQLTCHQCHQCKPLCLVGFGRLSTNSYKAALCNHRASQKEATFSSRQRLQAWFPHARTQNALRFNLHRTLIHVQAFQLLLLRRRKRLQATLLLLLVSGRRAHPRLCLQKAERTVCHSKSASSLSSKSKSKAESKSSVIPTSKIFPSFSTNLVGFLETNAVTKLNVGHRLDTLSNI